MKRRMNGKANWENRTLYHGDNLAFMRSMNSGSVHLIATDPPFNKGRDFHATLESLASGASFQDRWRWDEDVPPEWVEQIQDDWPGVWAVIDWTRMVHSDAMGAFLAFMAVRLMAMHRVLRDDGSIYLPCDPTASHYLKTLMDAVFGAKQFQNEFIWYYSGGGASRKRWARKHDVILFYSKGRAWTFNADAVRVPYKWTDGRKRAKGRWSSGPERMLSLDGPVPPRGPARAPRPDNTRPRRTPRTFSRALPAIANAVSRRSCPSTHRSPAPPSARVS